MNKREFKEVNGIELGTILAMSADTRATLRASDVDRVMSQAESAGVLNEFRAWLLESKKFEFGTKEEIENWVAE